MQVTFEEYTKRYEPFVSFNRQDGILEIRLHSGNDVCRWDGFMHNQIGFLFSDIGADQDNKIIIKKRINLGIAVATDVGLLVPTVYDADQYTLAGLAKQISAIAQRARTNKLTIQDMQNSTFVVNNPGTFGTIISVPIINQPNAGILSMDAVVKRPVVTEDDAIAIRYMMYLCLSFDHRIMDGAGAAGFLQAMRTKLQSYGREIDVY